MIHSDKTQNITALEALITPLINSPTSLKEATT
jgi:hypothetical protein